MHPKTSVCFVSGYGTASLVRCVKFTGCNFDIGGPLTEVVLLGNIAVRTGNKLLWDGKNMKITNDDKANRYIKEAYRSGWYL